MYENAVNNVVDSWDFKWSYALRKNNLLSIKKNLVYTSNMIRGQKILENDLTAKRTKDGIPAIEFSNVINKILRKSIKKDEVVKIKDFLK